MARKIWVSIGTSNDFLRDGTKPLPEPMFDLSSVGFNSTRQDQFHIEVPKITIGKMMTSLKNELVKLFPNLPWANE